MTMPEAEEHENADPDDQGGEIDVDEVGHIEGGHGRMSDHIGVDHDGDEEDEDEIPELLDTDVEEVVAPGAGGHTPDFHRAT